MKSGTFFLSVAVYSFVAMQHSHVGLFHDNKNTTMVTISDYVMTAQEIMNEPHCILTKLGRDLYDNMDALKWCARRQLIKKYFKYVACNNFCK